MVNIDRSPGKKPSMSLFEGCSTRELHNVRRNDIGATILNGCENQFNRRLYYLSDNNGYMEIISMHFF